MTISPTGRAPHTANAGEQPDPIPTNNRCCLSTVFSSCISTNESGEDAGCCVSLKAFGEMICSALSSCWSAITSFIMSIFGCTVPKPLPAEDLAAVSNFLIKWNPISRITTPLTPEEIAEWNSDMAALSETVRTKIRQGIDTKSSRQRRHRDPQGDAAAAMNNVVNWKVLGEMDVLIAEFCLSQVDAFLAKWKDVQEQSSSDETRTSWATDLQALLDLPTLGTELCYNYAHVVCNKMTNAEWNDKQKREELSASFMKAIINYAGVLYCLKRWKSMCIERVLERN